MTVFAEAVNATFAACGIEAVYTPTGGELVSVRVNAVARTPSSASATTTSMPRPRPSKCGRARSRARPGDQLTIGSEAFIVRGEPERRDPDRLVWTLDVRPA